MTESVTDKPHKIEANSTVVTAISGLLAASVGKSIMHPIDTIKAKLQVISIPGSISEQSKMPKGKSLILQLAKDTVNAEGIKGLYRGFGIHVVGSVPAGGLYFGGYELFKKNTLQFTYLQQHPFISYLLGGIFAEIIACMIFVPVDIIKERRQVQSNLKVYEYTSDFNAFRQIINTEGVRGMYRAYWATVASFGPFSALYFTFYEYFKGFFMKNDPLSYLRRTEKGAKIT